VGAGRGVALKGEGAAEAQKGEKGEDLGDSNYSEFYGLDTPPFILDSATEITTPETEIAEHSTGAPLGFPVPPVDGAQRRPHHT
jgi:hypothetical protein